MGAMQGVDGGIGDADGRARRERRRRRRQVGQSMALWGWRWDGRVGARVIGEKKEREGRPSGVDTDGGFLKLGIKFLGELNGAKLVWAAQSFDSGSARDCPSPGNIHCKNEILIIVQYIETVLLVLAEFRAESAAIE